MSGEFKDMDDSMEVIKSAMKEIKERYKHKLGNEEVEEDEE